MRTRSCGWMPAGGGTCSHTGMTTVMVGQPIQTRPCRFLCPATASPWTACTGGSIDPNWLTTDFKRKKCDDFLQRYPDWQKAKSFHTRMVTGPQHGRLFPAERGGSFVREGQSAHSEDHEEGEEEENDDKKSAVLHEANDGGRTASAQSVFASHAVIR